MLRDLCAKLLLMINNREKDINLTSRLTLRYRIRVVATCVLRITIVIASFKESLWLNLIDSLPGTSFGSLFWKKKEIEKVKGKSKDGIHSFIHSFIHRLLDTLRVYTICKRLKIEVCFKTFVT